MSANGSVLSNDLYKSSFPPSSLSPANFTSSLACDPSSSLTMSLLFNNTSVTDWAFESSLVELSFSSIKVRRHG